MVGERLNARVKGARSRRRARAFFRIFTAYTIIVERISDSHDVRTYVRVRHA